MKNRLSTSGLVSGLVVLVAVSFGMVACAPGSNCLDRSSCKDDDDSSDPPNADAEAAAAAAAAALVSCIVFGQPHIGLGGEDLAAQVDGPASGDRGRAKPYTALMTEYSRVLGSENAPASIKTTGPTFGIPSERWYLEPIPSAVFVNTAFDVAFEGCVKLTASDTKYATPPTKDSARAECTTWARRFWSHEATPGQLDACTTVAIESVSETFGRPGVDETTRATTSPRQWAYACASVLTATGFLTF